MAVKQPVLVTGLTGLVGQHLLGLSSSRCSWTPIKGFDKRVDIMNKSELTRSLEASQVPVVLHLAAFTDVGAAWKEVEDRNGRCYQLNVVGTRNVADACLATNKLLIHV